MSAFEAVRTGFRLAHRYPRIGAVETLWRTAFAILVVLFLLLGATSFLQNATLSNAEIQALRSKVPVIVTLVIQRILYRYHDELWHLFWFVIGMSGFMWLLFASLFRPGVVGLMCHAFQKEQGSKSVTDPESGFGKFTKMFFGRIAKVNFTYLFFSALIGFLSGGVFWISVKLGTLAGETLGPLVVIACLTVGLTALFVLWALTDLVTDMAQIAVVFEGASFVASFRRAAEVIQRRLGTVIGIGLILFILRMVLAILFTIINVATNFVFGQVWQPMQIPSTVILWFMQSIIIYYLYIVNLVGYATLFETQASAVSTDLTVPEGIIYEH